MLPPLFSLDNFEGPLELLLCLIQKEELDICTIMIKHLTLQMRDGLEQINIDASSEMLTLAATLLLLKSQRLLPQQTHGTEATETLRIETIQNLIEYSRIKEAALTLKLKEEEQKSFFPRAPTLLRREMGSGLEEISLETLKQLMLGVLERSRSEPQKTIHAEKWDVAGKILWLRHTLKEQKKMLFLNLFSSERARGELIVLFLALLELMKHQELKVVRESDLVYIVFNELELTRAKTENRA